MISGRYSADTVGVKSSNLFVPTRRIHGGPAHGRTPFFVKGSPHENPKDFSWRDCNASGLVDFESLYELMKGFDVLVAVAAEVGIVSQGVEPVPVEKAVHVGLEF